MFSEREFQIVGVRSYRGKPSLGVSRQPLAQRLFEQRRKLRFLWAHVVGREAISQISTAKSQAGSGDPFEGALDARRQLKKKSVSAAPNPSSVGGQRLIVDIHVREVRSLFQQAVAALERQGVAAAFAEKCRKPVEHRSIQESATLVWPPLDDLQIVRRERDHRDAAEVVLEILRPLSIDKCLARAGLQAHADLPRSPLHRKAPGDLGLLGTKTDQVDQLRGP